MLSLDFHSWLAITFGCFFRTNKWWLRNAPCSAMWMGVVMNNWYHSVVESESCVDASSYRVTHSWHSWWLSPANGVYKLVCAFYAPPCSLLYALTIWTYRVQVAVAESPENKTTYASGTHGKRKQFLIIVIRARRVINHTALVAAVDIAYNNNIHEYILY